MPEHPPTRWELAGRRTSGYGEMFGRLVDDGADVDGEARLADALCPRGARVLDVGSGMGRVAAGLRRRGHHVVATEPDPALREQSRATYPDLDVLPHQALDVPGYSGPFDVVVVVGNVMVYLGEGTEADVLAHLGSLLAPGGRLLVGFDLDSDKPGARSYPACSAFSVGMGALHPLPAWRARRPASASTRWRRPRTATSRSGSPT